jgi:GT2 family glycosyltransferase
MKLSIVILSYNTKDLTLFCLNSLFEIYEKEFKKEIEILVVDNASSDDTVSAVSKLQSQIPNLRIIVNKENFGFSKGNNIGAKASMGNFILFLNSDTEIKDKGLIRMLEFMENNNRAGILGGKLKNPDNSVQKSAGKFYSLFNLFLMLIGLERLGFLRSSPSKVSRVDWVSGASMMVRKEVFKKIGGFDEKLFMYMEDMELCFRAGKAGFFTYFYPNIELIHKERGSGNKTFAIIQIYKGILYFYKKYMPTWQYDMVKKMLRTKAKILVVLGKIINNRYLVETYSQAYQL